MQPALTDPQASAGGFGFGWAAGCHQHALCISPARPAPLTWQASVACGPRGGPPWRGWRHRRLTDGEKRGSGASVRGFGPQSEESERQSPVIRLRSRIRLLSAGRGCYPFEAAPGAIAFDVGRSVPSHSALVCVAMAPTKALQRSTARQCYATVFVFNQCNWMCASSIQAGKASNPGRDVDQQCRAGGISHTGAAAAGTAAIAAIAATSAERTLCRCSLPLGCLHSCCRCCF